MVDKVVESEINSKDRIAWGAAIVVAGLGIFGFYYFSSYPLIYRVLGLVLVFIFESVNFFSVFRIVVFGIFWFNCLAVWEVLF